MEEKAVRVALVKGDDRKNNILRALSLVKDDICVSKPVLIKPNFVSTTTALAATHRDAVDATLQFLSELGVKRFIIGEAPAFTSAHHGYENFGYYELANRYDIQFIDLHQDQPEKLKIVGKDFSPFEVRIAKTPLECYRVSVTRLKTHDTVIATLGIKNMAVGCIMGSKSVVHQGCAQINLSIAALAKHLLPDLTVIDGLVGMEGDGPVAGTPISAGVALASTDAVAVDTVAACVMGFDPANIGYLYYCKEMGLGCGDIERIQVLGNTIEKCKMRFRPHSTYSEQLRWRIEKWRDILERL